LNIAYWGAGTNKGAPEVALRSELSMECPCFFALET
jgi:hypothetical protein